MNENTHRTSLASAQPLPASSGAKVGSEGDEDPHADAQAAVDALTGELRRLGITLPSLGLDLPSYTVTTAACPLIELGRVNPTTAARLVRVLRTARADTE
ncbi:hypothetical protein [Streptomyces sp. NBC_00102]|uniref:hypothetical protein n=1 Tax=Streptomyces sp. NBC_00102 TaxID=2975652 RepID=UPI0022508448|nr:hypothetical protein [Streptomyces sp. NBC_00102]MCX5399082.1 hypothetical protein [Streptomyces sp. NBC_00102]